MRIELLLFLSFLTLVIVLIACSAPRRPTPAASSTLFAPLSLTTYDPRLIGRVSMEVDIRTTVAAAKRQWPQLEISPPRCFRTIAPQLTCFGAIYNRMSSAAGEISLAARIRGGIGTPSPATVVSIEQRRVEGGAKAAYRVHFPDGGSEDLALELSLADAKLAPTKIRALKFEEREAEYVAVDNRYRLRGLLLNESSAPLTDIRLVVRLEDDEGVIVGYRALDLDGTLAANGTQEVDLSITPLEYASEFRHQVVAQALAAD